MKPSTTAKLKTGATDESSRLGSEKRKKKKKNGDGH